MRLWFRKHKSLLLKFFTFGLCLLLLLCYTQRKGTTIAAKPKETICPGAHRLVTEYTQQHNVDFIKTYPFPGQNIPKFKEYFGFDERVELTGSRDVPVIGTAASSNHFAESLLLLEHIERRLFPVYRALKVYYYDIGLSDRQRERIQGFQRVEVRRFPFSHFPDHVGKLKGYAWKPIVIQLLLREFGFVMWMDTSVRLTSANQDDLFLAAKNHGVVYRPGFYSIVVHTDRDTFSFLNETPCLFSNQNEIEANFMIVYRTQFVNDFFMKPVVLCALSFGCMVTDSSEQMLDCTDKTNPHTCHRFDQSVFTILVTRLFGSNRTNHVPTYSEVHLCRAAEFSPLGEVLNRVLVKFIYWWTSQQSICFE